MSANEKDLIFFGTDGIRGNATTLLTNQLVKKVGFYCNKILPNNRPILSDLRDSGAIEQDADVVAFLYRHSQYDKSDLESRGKAEVNIAKQRNGPTDTVQLAFIEDIATFQNLSNIDYSPPIEEEDS